jgi:hypothetical protein
MAWGAEMSGRDTNSKAEGFPQVLERTLGPIFQWFSLIAATVSLLDITHLFFNLHFTPTLASLISFYEGWINFAAKALGANLQYVESAGAALVIAAILSFRISIRVPARFEPNTILRPVMRAIAYVGKGALWLFQGLLLIVIGQLLLNYPPFKALIDHFWDHMH